MQTAGKIALGTFDSEVLPSSLVEIAPILRVANEVQEISPRADFMPLRKLTGWTPVQPVEVFANSKLHFSNAWKRKENDLTLEGRVKTDAHTMQSFYQHYYKKYIQALRNADDKANNRESISKAYQTADVLFEVLQAVNIFTDTELYHEILEAQDKVFETKKMFVPYNILPLDPNGANQAIMQFPEA
ncbi:hypothetical protein PIB30_048219 [Stylosanthes scabra]|uniref:Uncharacterized protein n=1 Tax=Stylosanthes scabra TaxID=79078 RepID=A0ABU6TGM0_9FABA|nr:hypothetical protein [Stylosanthes scabra]